jgi:hypothetical protein
VVALSNEDIAVNSLEVLSLPIETIDQQIASNISTNIASEIKPEIKLDIQSLLAANQEYSKNQPIETEASETNIQSIASQVAEFVSIDTNVLFGDFLIGSGGPLLE